MAVTSGGYDRNSRLDSVFVLMEEVYHDQFPPLTSEEETAALDVDPFDGGDEPYTTLSDRFVNGRNAYKCSLCLQRFPRCRHRVTTQVVHGIQPPMAFRFCGACSRSCAESLSGDGEGLVRRFQIANIVWEGQEKWL